MWGRRTRRRKASMPFLTDFTDGMPPAFQMPEEFLALAEWTEKQGFTGVGGNYIVDPEAEEHCMVYLNGSVRVPWPADYLPDPDRLWSVAASGSDGSEFCLWIDNEGRQQVVHHGSGSGSTLWAVLPSALSVLRLLAVGYEEPCYNDEWAEPPHEDSSALAPYRKWLQETWGQTTPHTGLEALGVTGAEADAWLKHGPDKDPFSAWLQSA